MENEEYDDWCSRISKMIRESDSRSGPDDICSRLVRMIKEMNKENNDGE